MRSHLWKFNSSRFDKCCQSWNIPVGLRILLSLPFNAHNNLRILLGLPFNAHNNLRILLGLPFNAHNNLRILLGLPFNAHVYLLGPLVGQLGM